MNTLKHKVHVTSPHPDVARPQLETAICQVVSDARLNIKAVAGVVTNLVGPVHAPYAQASHKTQVGIHQMWIWHSCRLPFL